MDNQLIEQQPPHSDEAERAVLGGIFHCRMPRNT